MVEIIPYTEDDEDQSNWVPLTPAASPTNGPGGALRSNDSTSAATSAQTVRGHGAPSSNMSPAAVQSKNTNDNDGTTHSVSIDNHHLAESQESAVFVENNVDTDEEEDEDDHDWQAIPSHNDLPTQEESLNSNGGASSASSVVDQSTSLSWGKQIISHLTSTATATTTSATTELEEEYVSESEDDIVWSKADTLTDRDPMLNSSARRDRASIEKEYDDDKISSMKVSSSQKIHVTAEADGTSKFEQPPSQTKSQQRVPLELDEEKAEDEDEESKFRRVNEEQPQENQNQYNNQYNQTQSNNRPRTTYVKTKLQQKLIHDPLRALPFSFLCHLYHEAKLQFTKAWNAYTIQNELATIMAPLSLFVLMALVGIGFIGVGLVGLATVMLHYLVNFSVSFSAWMIEYSWRMAYQLVWMSVCTFLIVGGMVWVWLQMGAKLPSWRSALFFETPSISTFVPWIIALTSPSVYEATIIIFSLSMSVSVLIPGSHVDECLLSTGRNEEDPTCLVGGVELDDHYSFALASIAGAFLIAILNVAVVAFAANWLEDSNGKQLADRSGKDIATKSSSEESTESTPPPCSSNGSRYLDQVQRHCLCICHTISVLSLAGLSIIVLIIQTIYTHYLNEGGNILYSLVNCLGVVGCNILYMALGIFLLIALCNITAESITINNVAFANGISVGAISRNALKKSILEISSNAVWSKDDNWSGLLGILSDDDGALRVAILEWVIDRWTASSSASTDETGTSHTTPSSESMDSESSEGFTEPVGGDSGVENIASNDDQAKPNSFQSNISNDHPYSSNNQTQQDNTNEHNNNTSASNQQSSQPSYQSLQSVILQLDADETLLPTIERYRAWVYSLPPSQNAAVYVALWKMCPAAAVLGLVAFYCIGWAVINWFVLTLAWIVGASTSRGASHSDIILVIGMVATMLSPLLFLEYQRTSQWWATVVNQLEEADTSTHTSNDSDRRDIVMVILRADSTDDNQHWPMNDQLYTDSSSVFHQIWLLLLESIALLESAIQPVRYATVASAAVDLTSDTVCLLDLALEVKKRGLIGGVGIIIWDAFQYSLSKEIKQRKNEAGDATNSRDGTRERQESQDEEGDLGGKYTGSIVSAVGNLGKMSHNISCLMESRSENDKASNNGSDGCDGNGAAKSNEDEGARRQSEASASED